MQVLCVILQCHGLKNALVVVHKYTKINSKSSSELQLICKPCRFVLEFLGQHQLYLYMYKLL